MGKYKEKEVRYLPFSVMGGIIIAFGIHNLQVHGWNSGTFLFVMCLMLLVFVIAATRVIVYYENLIARVDMSLEAILKKHDINRNYDNVS